MDLDNKIKLSMDKYTQEDVDEFCSDIYFDFFVDLVDFGHIFNLDINKIILNIIQNDGIELFKLFESKGLVELNKEKVITRLIYAYSQESKSIIEYIKLKHYNLFVITDHDKTYFMQNCLVCLSQYGKLDMIIELDNMFKIDWNQSILIDKELGDKINQISESRFIILSKTDININEHGYGTLTWNLVSLGNKVLAVLRSYNILLSNIKLENIYV